MYNWIKKGNTWKRRGGVPEAQKKKKEFINAIRYICNEEKVEFDSELKNFKEGKHRKHCTGRCICSKRINKCFTLEHINGHSFKVKVGCECVRKVNPELGEKLLRLSNKPCVECGGVVEKKGYKVKDDGRVCVNCTALILTCGKVYYGCSIKTVFETDKGYFENVLLKTKGKGEGKSQWGLWNWLNYAQQEYCNNKKNE